MFILRKEFRFESAHYLPLVPDRHPCKRLHGHSYAVVIEVGSKHLKKNGFVIDFADINTLIKPVIENLDHQLLNDFVENPTVENMCVYIAEKFSRNAQAQKQDVHLLAVEVSETAKTKCRLELGGTD